jgi:hypothetical protein
MASATYSTPDAKKEEFRKYLLVWFFFSSALLIWPLVTKWPRLTFFCPTTFSFSHSCARPSDKAGVVDALTKVLVGLYEEPERPPNAVEYVKKVLGAPVGVDVDALKAENEQLRQVRLLFGALIKPCPSSSHDDQPNVYPHPPSP